MEQRAKSMLDSNLGERLAGREFESLSTWCKNTECAIKLLHWLGGGNTQAQLAVVLIRDRHSTRKGVLKYCPARSGPPGDFLAFTRASRSGPAGFAQQHLVGIDPATDKPIPNGSDGLFLLMRWGEGGPDNYNTMANLLDREILGIACETIVKSTLLDWNNVEHEVEGLNTDLSAVSFLREVLGRRCQPGGPIYEAAGMLGISRSEPYLDTLAGSLPNPLAAATAGTLIDKINVLGFRGNAHGDLHADNIMIPFPRAEILSPEHFARYVLIDLSTFGDSKLITVDPAHLLLSIIARRLNEVSPSRNNQLARLVLEPERAESGGIPVELTHAARGIQRAGIAFASSVNLYEEWYIESTLAIAACALLFVGRDLPDEDRRWFLMLSGMAIDAVSKMQPKADSSAKADDAISLGRAIPISGAATVARPSPSASPTHSISPEPTAVAEVTSHESSSPSHDPARVKPAPDSSSPPLEVPMPVISLIPLALKTEVAACAGLADELAAEVDGLDEGISADAARDYLLTARDIVDDLSTAIRRMAGWNHESTTEWHITYLAAIEAARLRVRGVTELLNAISEQGTSPWTQDEFTAVVDRLQNAIREIIPPSDL